MRERDRRLLLRFRDLDRLGPPRPWPAADILRSRAGAEPPLQSSSWRRVASVAVALAVAIAGTTFGIWALRPFESERRPAGAPAESIAFVRDVGGNPEIFVMNGDGTGLIRLTHSPPDLPEDQAADIQPAWSPDGTRIAFASRRDGNFEIYAMNADGSELTRLIDDPAENVEPAWSPDGAKIVFTRDPDTPGVSGDIYVMNADGSDVTRLTDDPGNDRHPSWSPNGAQIAFQSERAAVGVNSDIYLMNADGSALIPLTSGPSYDAAPAWSPDGRKIAYEESPPDGRGPPDGDLEIAVMNADGSGKTLLTDNDTDDADLDWSPDGSKIAFIRMLPDRSVSIFAINADGTGEKQLTNAELLDSGPAWRPQPAETPSSTPSR
jgi:Tol biopolymer transport system component